MNIYLVLVAFIALWWFTSGTGIQQGGGTNRTPFAQVWTPFNNQPCGVPEIDLYY